MHGFGEEVGALPGEAFLEVVMRQGLVEQIPLCHAAVNLSQKSRLIGRLHTLCDDLHVKFVDYVHDIFDDNHIGFLALFQIFQERFVQLKLHRH